MKLTKKGYYGVKALLDLSLQPSNQVVSVKAIAERQQLPAPYLEKILIKIRQAGLIKSIRGVQGGYLLAFPPEKISLGEILIAVGEKIEPIAITTTIKNTNAEDWVTQTLWRRLNQKFTEAIFNITLADLYYDARSRRASFGEANNFVV